MTTAFTEEQKQYLQGFMAGVAQRGAAPYVGMTGDGRITNDPAEGGSNQAGKSPETLHGTPIEDLCKEELIKLDQNPLDIWEKLIAHADQNKFPDASDTFRFKFHGLFYVAPAQNSFMLRCRIPGCVLTSAQLRGLARIAKDWGGGFADITTRGNVQIREIQPKYIVNVLTTLADLGLTSRGSGADNVRNITASPTSGFDPNELIDVLPYARALHYYILNNRDLYGLPRKFNISFDSGGDVSVAADTNDIGFFAVRVPEGRGIEPGIYFRIELGGITGHGDFSRDTGYLVRPDECTAVAAAMLRVFNENGDRTNRKRARLKYLLEAWGIPKFMDATQVRLAFPMRRATPDDFEKRRPIVRHGHLGIHPQTEAGLSYVGVSTPVGRVTSSQMTKLADGAEDFARGEMRLTVFQNLIIPHVPTANLDALKKAIAKADLSHEASNVCGGIVACTGNTGCKFAATNTKGQAMAIGRHLEDRVLLDKPINIHLTGCPHSCAQHYVGDIGLLGVKVNGEEGYNVVVGGGMDHEQGIARDLFRNVTFPEVPPLLERMLKSYLEKRTGSESFLEFTRRHDLAKLQEIFS